MKDLGPGFPEWTELGQDGGLDPLGMQRPIEAIYQSLLPGISTITLRFRYYSFFVWKPLQQKSVNSERYSYAA